MSTDGQTTCPLCLAHSGDFHAHAWDSEYRTSAEKYEYRRCASCDVIYLVDPPVDQLRTIYPENYYSYAPPARRSLLGATKEWLDGRLFRRLITGLNRKAVSVLDVGGGCGWVAGLIRRQNPVVTRTAIVDIDESAMAVARDNGHEFHLGSADQFEAAGEFDLIVMLNIFEHVASPVTLLTQMRRSLCDDGVILVKTPNIGGIDARIFRRHNWGGFHCPRHWVLFSRSSMVKAAEMAGLRVVELSFTQGAPQWVASILGWLSDKGAISITRERPMHLHPLYAPLLVLMAGFDFIRLPFAQTAQMFVVLRKC